MQPNQAPEWPSPGPLAHFVTFACYGARIHGDPRGSVDRWHNQPGSRHAPESPGRETYIRSRMTQEPYLLDEPRRRTVLQSLLDTCRRWNWTIQAAHVRSNHVHVLVSAAADREELLQVLKANATKALREAHDEPEGLKRWARHGSVRTLWKEEAVTETWDYIINGQGAPTAVHPSPSQTQRTSASLREPSSPNTARTSNPEATNRRNLLAVNPPELQPKPATPPPARPATRSHPNEPPGFPGGKSV